MKCFGDTIEITVSKESYQKIWELIKESGLGYSSVEEFVQEIFMDILKLVWKAFAYELQERALSYPV